MRPLELVPNNRRDGYIHYLNNVYKNGLHKLRADSNNARNQFIETNMRINKQLQQHRKKLFGWQDKCKLGKFYTPNMWDEWEKRYNITKMPVHHRRQQKIIGYEIGWEIESDLEFEYVEEDLKKVRSRTLYIGFWHDKFFKNVCIDMDKLHNEASAFGNVLKLKTFPSKPPYECAFIVFESRNVAEKARTGLSLEFNDFFIQYIEWAQPPDCAGSGHKAFDFYEGIGYVLRFMPLTRSQSHSLISGFMRRFNDHSFVPFDVTQLCISYVSEWKDLKISFVDDVTGNIDTTKYQIKAVSSNQSIDLIAKEIQNDIYRDIVSTEYNRLRASCLKLSWNSKEQRDQFIKDKMMKKFVEFEPAINWNKPKFDEIRWCGYENPLVHVWLKFKQMKKIYLRKSYESDDEFAILKEEMYENEDEDRWVEVPLRYYEYLKINEIDSFDIDNDCLVIERCNIQNDDWYSVHWNVICRWPTEQGDDWRETLQVGDIVDVYYSGCCDGYAERAVRYIYPNDHETMSGKCVAGVHAQNKVLDINSRAIIKRYTYQRQCQRDRRCEYFELNKEYDEPVPSVKENEVMSSHTVGHKAYEIEKYSKNHKAKKIYPQKKKLRRKMKKYGVKSGAKRIENKMKKYKNRYECLEY